MASSSEIVTAPGFWASVCACGGDDDGLCAGGVCAPAAPERNTEASSIGKHRRCERMEISLLKRAISSEWCCGQHVSNAADYAGGARAGVRRMAGRDRKLKR